MFDLVLIPTVALGILGFIKTIQGSLLDKFFRSLHIGGFMDFIINHYAYLFAFFLVVLLYFKFNKSKLFLIITFIGLILFFKFLLNW